MSANQCPACKQVWEPGVRFCPNDGTPLADTAALSGVPTPTAAQTNSVRMQLPTVIGGRYRLDEVRGGGGMAKVYKAFDLNLEREVAVKLINPELRSDPEFDARFQREARIASQLNDPHIVVVHDFGIDHDTGPYLVMEYLEGESLREVLSRQKTLPYKAGLQIAGQLFLALIHAHGKDIVHRDIKPDNIFLLQQSGVRLHIRVLDYGIARIMRRDQPGSHTLTLAGSAIGTPRYMSPEQLAAVPDLDARSDIYSAALVVFELLTGTLPSLTGKKLTELCPEASPQLQELLEQCLKADRNERPPSAVEVYLRLQELGKASGVLLLPAGAMEQLVQQRRAATAPAGEPTTPLTPTRLIRNRRALVLASTTLLALLAAAAFSGWWFWPRPAPPPADRETLLGVKVGDPQNAAAEKLHVKFAFQGDPWSQKKRAPLLGPALTVSDLRLPPEKLAEVEMFASDDGEVCALFLEQKLLALVVRQRKHAATSRGVAMHMTYGDIFERYDESPELKTVESSGPEGKAAPVRVVRFDSRGVLFECSTAPGAGGVRHPKDVVGIALYPPAE